MPATIAVVSLTLAAGLSASVGEGKQTPLASWSRSVQQIDGLGMDAWLSGGTSLRVLVRESEWVALSTQMYQPQSREWLVQIARSILRR